MTTIQPFDLIDFPGMSTAVVRAEDLAMSELREFFDPAFNVLGRVIAEGRISPTGPAFARYDAPPTEAVSLEAGFPVAEPLDGPLHLDGLEICASSLPKCRLAVTKHRGSYDLLGEAWADFASDVARAGLVAATPIWEAYDTMPQPDMDPGELVTGLAMPLANSH